VNNNRHSYNRPTLQLHGRAGLQNAADVCGA